MNKYNDLPSKSPEVYEDDDEDSDTIENIIRKRKKIKNKIKKFQIKITDLEYKLIQLDRKESE